MQLSVIILNYNVRWFLQQCLDSVMRATTGLDAQIIVVDNASPDDSCLMVREYFPDVVLIKNPENSGFPKGNNLGVAAAKGRFICILNPDTVVAPDTFTKAISYFESLENPGIVGVKLMDGRGHFLPESKRGIPTPWVAATKISGLYKLSPKWFGRYYASHLTPNQSGQADILVGAFMLMEKSLYDSLGGFDENCFMYSDDIDLSYRALQMGRTNFYFAGTQVIHYKGESTVKDARYLNRFREAMVYFYDKHYGHSASGRIFNVLMKAGAHFFALTKKNTLGVTVRPSGWYLLSQNEALKAALEEKLSVSLISVTNVDGIKEGSRLLLDSNELGYGQIMAIMLSATAKDLTFRIVHPRDGFLIGSDSSNDRGEVVTFAAHR